MNSARFKLLFSFALLAAFSSPAQTSPPTTTNTASPIMVVQPPVDVTSPVTATATFDFPTVAPGESTYYRVTLDATESSIQWPEKIITPTGLQLGPGIQGQIMEAFPDRFRPLTSFVYAARATNAGRFTLPAFTIKVYGKPVEIPAASLQATADGSISNGPAWRLGLETSATNVYLGQVFHTRVLLPAAGSNLVEALREVKLNGDGFITDKSTLRQSVEPVQRDGRSLPAYIYQVDVIPIAPGQLELSAQGYTAGREFIGPITIQSPVVIPNGPTRYILLGSDAVTIHVHSLPAAGRLPGSTGAIGTFACDPPRLSTNRVQTGFPVQLKMAIHNADGLGRLVPPELPQVPDWQIIPEKSGEGVAYTLIPLTSSTQATPAIPFSCFNPATASYVDLTIPAVPITVFEEGLPMTLPAMAEKSSATAPVKLSDLSPTPGKSASSLKPLQLRGWFIGLQLLPVLGIVGLWRWDHRRRYLEAHPEIVRRRRARRALHREQRGVQNAVISADTAAFVRHATAAMRIACAPHYPADPQALVCADVLAQLDPAQCQGAEGEVIRRIFAAAYEQFALRPQTHAELIALEMQVNAVLRLLEDRL